MIDKVWSRDRVAQVEGKFCDPWALQAVVRWCYTARLEISPGHRLACLGFLHDLGLQELEGKLSMEGLQGEREHLYSSIFCLQYAFVLCCPLTGKCLLNLFWACPLPMQTLKAAILQISCQKSVLLTIW